MTRRLPRDPRGNPIPNRAVSWSAEPGEVASVSSNGLVTAIRPGTATVRAMVETVSGTAVISVIQPAAPTPPPQLDAVANGTDVRLTWAYDDTTAARLEVLRLNTSTGTLATVATLDPEATTYEDATGSVESTYCCTMYLSTSRCRSVSRSTICTPRGRLALSPSEC